VPEIFRSLRATFHHEISFSVKIPSYILSGEVELEKRGYLNPRGSGWSQLLQQGKVAAAKKKGKKTPDSQPGGCRIHPRARLGLGLEIPVELECFFERILPQVRILMIS
jgi:hypothetical protein